MDPLTELLKTAQNGRKPMQHRMHAAHQALRAMPVDAPEEVWRPFRDLFNEVMQHEPPCAEALRADAANVALWWDSRRRSGMPAVLDLGEPITEDTAAGMSRSLAKVRAIMLDPATVLPRRLDAAEILLEHELAAGAGVGVPPNQIASEAYQFLRAVEPSDAPEAHRFRALRAIVRIENTRKAALRGSAQYAAKRELLVNLVNAERRRLLIEAGRWLPLAGAQWALSSADEFDWLPGWPGSWHWPPPNFGDLLDRASRKPEAELRASREAIRAELRAIRAKNRVDEWEQLLGDQAA